MPEKVRTKKKVRIYMNHLPFKLDKNTDYFMVLNFKNLENLYPELSFYYPTSFVFSFFANLINQWNKCVFKLMRLLKKNLRFLCLTPLQKYYLGPEFKPGNFDIVFMRGGDYVDIYKHYNDYETKVLYEALFIDPENIDGCYNDANKSNWQKDVIFMQECAKQNMIINLRSNYSVQLAKKMFPSAKSKFVNIFFPIDNRMERMDMENIRQKHLCLNYNSPICFLICGEEAKRKGLVNLVEAFNALYEKYGDRVKLIVVSGQAESLIPNINEIKGIEYCGALNHIAALKKFAISHVYIMPSLYETFGLSYIEGLAYGCVVVARNFEPQREILDYGQSGFLVNPFSVDEIFSVMEKIVLMSNNERLSWAIKGHKKFLKEYSFEVVSKKWYNVFTHVEYL